MPHAYGVRDMEDNLHMIAKWLQRGTRGVRTWSWNTRHRSASKLITMDRFLTNRAVGNRVGSCGAETVWAGARYDGTVSASIGESYKLREG